MGLRKTCPLCGHKYFSLTNPRCPNCDNIDFKNIDMIYLADAETAYRIEAEEEFDIVKTAFLTHLDGWQHYETETVEYEVPDGENYTFLIMYKNGSHEYRKYHCASPIVQKLLTHNEYFDMEKEVDDVISEIRNIFSSE